MLALIQIGPPSDAILRCPAATDCSWTADDYLAVLHHAKFGSAYVWPYGPLGFADSMLTIGGHLMGVAYLAEVALSSLLAMLVVYVLRFRLQLPSIYVAIGILGLLLPPYLGLGKLELIAPVCALILLFAGSEKAIRADARRGIDTGSTLAFGSAGVLLALAPLVKASQLAFVVGTIVMWSMHMCLRRHWRTVLVLVVPFLLIWCGTFATFGGGVSAAITWPIAEVPVLAGYSPAMAVSGSAWYLLLAGMLGVVTVVPAAFIITNRGDKWWFVGAIALLWFGAFKETFVRQDVHHIPHGLFSTGPWCSFLLWWASRNLQAADTQVASGWRVSVSQGVTVCTSVACIMCLLIVGHQTPVAVPDVVSAVAKLRQLATIPVDVMASPDRIQDMLADDERGGIAIRDGLQPLVPRLRGHQAFAWPFDGNAVLSAGALEVFPPVPQEYAAYTPALDRMDADFFASPTRPALGLVSVDSIDYRLPLQTAGLSFLKLLACYRPAVLSENYLLVESRSTPPPACAPGAPDASTVTPWRAAQLGQELPVPSAPGHVTMMEIRIRMSLLGSLATWVFRPAPLSLVMRFSDGRVEPFRMVQATLRDGVLVSTVLSDTADLARLWLGDATDTVTSVALTTGRPEEWQSSFRLRFVEVPIPAPASGLKASPGGSYDMVMDLEGGKVGPVPPALRELFVHDIDARWAWIVLTTTYDARSDLQHAFPTDAPSFPNPLLQWALTFGTSIDGASTMLQPYRHEYQVMENVLAASAIR